MLSCLSGRPALWSLVRHGRADVTNTTQVMLLGTVTLTLPYSRWLIGGCRQFAALHASASNASREQVVLGMTILLCMCVHLMTQHRHYTVFDPE